MEAGVVGVAIIVGSYIIYRQIGKLTDVLMFAIIKHALVSNFSRFGQLANNTSIAVIDDTRAYFVREGALWVANFENDDLVMESARPIDLVGADVELLKEAMIAVDVLNNHPGTDDDEDEEGSNA